MDFFLRRLEYALENSDDTELSQETWDMLRLEANTWDLLQILLSYVYRLYVTYN